MFDYTKLAPTVRTAATRNLERYARQHTLDLAAWHCFRETLPAALKALPLNRDGRLIRGPFGQGEPIYGARVICFNGNADGFYWWREQKKADPTFSRSKYRCYDDAHEDFRLWRQRAAFQPADYCYSEEINTGGKRYTVAVLVALTLLRWHFPNQTRILVTSCTNEQWREAGNVLYELTGTWMLPPELCIVAPPAMRNVG